MDPFPVQSFRGSGNKVVKFTIPEGSAGIATFTYSGGSNFIVETVDASGETGQLLVNTIGRYSGKVAFDMRESEHSVALRIKSSGAWTAKVAPITSARVWDGASVLKGKGDDVMIVLPAVSGLTTALITNSGDDNFVVVGYSDSGSDLIVNEIGRYSGEELLTPTTFLLTVESSGSWSITPN